MLVSGQNLKLILEHSTSDFFFHLSTLFVKIILIEVPLRNRLKDCFTGTQEHMLYPLVVIVLLP